MISIELFLATGAFAGLTAGVFGIGGGLVCVPVMVSIFMANDIPRDVVLPLAFGTSLAMIVPTAISGSLAHHARGMIDWRSVSRLWWALVIGAAIGALSTPYLPTHLLRFVFVAFVLFAAFRMLRTTTDAADSSRLLDGSTVPVGLLIGLTSGLIGVGGGTLLVPYLVFMRVPVKKAIGTSSVLTLPLALTGALFYAVGGVATPGLPPYSAGYIYLPAFFLLAATSIFFAPLGARLAHVLPVAVLKPLFGLTLLAVAARAMLTFQ
jgi:uncharacterized protein